MFSTLVEGIGYFWLQIRIVRVKILPGVTSRGLEAWMQTRINAVYVLFGGHNSDPGGRIWTKIEHVKATSLRLSPGPS